MNVVAIEQVFTAWVAEKLNLTVDENIFRGAIPDGVGQGVGVRFGSEVPNTGFYGFRPRTWNVQILGKSGDRDAAMELLAGLSGLFPCADFKYRNVRFRSVIPAGVPEPYSADDGGSEKIFLSFNVVLSVLTTGIQVNPDKEDNA